MSPLSLLAWAASIGVSTLIVGIAIAVAIVVVRSADRNS